MRLLAGYCETKYYGIKLAEARVMKMGMAMSPMTGEAKVIRLVESSRELRRIARQKSLVKLRHELAEGARKTFIFLLGATVLVFLFCHEKRIQHVTEAKVGRMVAKMESSSQNSPGQQNAKKYQNELDEITP
jgi:hypothetical protein